MGRPSKTEPRDKQLNLSLTASEYENIAQRAEAFGMRPVHFGRALLLDHGRTPRTSPRARSENSWTLLRLQLSRIGNNLNQLLAYCHSTKAELPPDLEPLLRDIRNLIARVPNDHQEFR